MPFLLSNAISFTISDYFLLDPLNRLIHPPLLQLAFPNNDNTPPLCLQLSPDFLIPFLVSCHFGYPEIRVGFGNCVILTVFVAMPEATVDEYDRSVFWKDDVGASGEAFIVYPIAET